MAKSVGFVFAISMGGRTPEETSYTHTRIKKMQFKLKKINVKIIVLVLHSY